MILFGLDILLVGLTYLTIKNLFGDEKKHIAVEIPPTYQQAQDNSDIPPAYT